MTYNCTASVSRNRATANRCGIASRSHQYDTLGRPTSRTLARQGATRNDVFTYNDRSELISDVVDGTGLNGWDYDNIGNRLLQQQGSAYDTYTSNALNQYTAIEDETHDVFTPTYDDDGNQTRIKISTGIWNVTYNAKNRPVLFSKEGENLTVACTYDYMGRRATKVVTENGVITTSHRFLYRGYLQIACCDRKRVNHPCLWLITWDPTQPVATRPLAIQKDSTWYTYGWDLTKNVCEVYGSTGYIRAAYEYSPYGEGDAVGDVTQPLRWGSEYEDEETKLTYYNWRYYSPVFGRWVVKDLLLEKQQYNLYRYCSNSPIYLYDQLGNAYSNQSSAARAAIRRWSNASIRNDIEYCGLICKDKKTSKYTYTGGAGDISSCYPFDFPCPACSLVIAYWHTHGAFIDNDNDGNEDRGYLTEEFSTDDYDLADSYDVDAYVGTPFGKVIMYDHNNGVEYNKRPWNK